MLGCGFCSAVAVFREPAHLPTPTHPLAYPRTYLLTYLLPFTHSLTHSLTHLFRLQALSWSSALLALDDVPSNLKFFARLYACNALCYLSRSAEALPHLTDAMQLGEAPPPESPPSHVEGEVACVRNPYSTIPQTAHAAGQAVARSVLHTNLATVHIMSGDLKQASQCAQKALELQPNSRNALLCLVYLEIRGGNLEAAREIMTKQVVPEPPAALSS